MPQPDYIIAFSNVIPVFFYTASWCFAVFLLHPTPRARELRVIHASGYVARVRINGLLFSARRNVEPSSSYPLDSHDEILSPDSPLPCLQILGSNSSFDSVAFHRVLTPHILALAQKPLFCFRPCASCCLCVPATLFTNGRAQLVFFVIVAVHIVWRWRSRNCSG